MGWAKNATTGRRKIAYQAPTPAATLMRESPGGLGAGIDTGRSSITEPLRPSAEVELDRGGPKNARAHLETWTWAFLKEELCKHVRTHHCGALSRALLNPQPPLPKGGGRPVATRVAADTPFDFLGGGGGGGGGDGGGRNRNRGSYKTPCQSFQWQEGEVQPVRQHLHES